MKTIGVIARPDLREAGPVLRNLVSWLRSQGASVCLSGPTAALMDGISPGECWVGPGAEVASRADAMVVLGGDGTLLRASHLLDKRSVPVLGVNFGSLGFLTEITLDELYPSLASLLADSYAYQDRTMLRAVIHRSGEPPVTGEALNDVVVTKAAVVSRIIELDVAVDGVFVSSFRADGLIVSTPTGSTAYNLAAGGPILHPALAALVVTPICPHMLTNRPLVIGDQASLEVSLRTSNVEVHVTLDGQEGFALGDRDRVVVGRSPRTLRLVTAPGRDYFEVLRTKLKWGESRNAAAGPESRDRTPARRDGPE